jgi:TolB protein
MYAHLQEQPRLVTADRPELPKEIDAVIARAMAKAPGERQPSAGALAEEAARALHVGVPSQADGSGGRRSPIRRLVPVIAVAAALVAGLVLSTLLRNETPEAPVAVGDTGPAASPSPTVEPAFPTVERALDPDEDRLLAAIPSGVNGNCLPLNRPEPVQGELAALVCDDGDVEVLYELFPTRSAMDAALQQGVNSQQAPPGDCATDTLAVSPYTIGREPAGRVLCYTIEAGLARDAVGEPSRSHIEWTDENSSIYAHAVRNDLGDLSLYEWWLDSSGPVIADESVTGFTKDRPPTAPISGPPDGSYLAATGPCAPDRNGTCVMHIEGSTYDIRNAGFTPFLKGEVLLRKPASVVFAPQIGFCHDEGRSTKPASYTWTEAGDELSFERTGGGTCGGPTFADPWTRAPRGLIALSQGGAINLADPAGFFVDEVIGPHDTSPNQDPDWSPDGSTIVFTGASQEGADVYAVGADGRDRTRLTDEPGDEYTPSWSPDGGSIAYAFDDGVDVHWTSGIAVIGPDGSGNRVLTSRREQLFAKPLWSPDGTRIAFTVLAGASSNAPHAYVMNADGSGLAELSSRPAAVLSWMPVGDRIVLSSGEDLVTVGPDGSGERVLLDDPPEAGRLELDWSPDGRWVIMASGGPNQSDANLYLMRGDASEVFLVGKGTTPSWRPDVS